MTIFHDQKAFLSAGKHLIVVSPAVVDAVADLPTYGAENNGSPKPRKNARRLTRENFRMGLRHFVLAEKSGWKPSTIKGYFLGGFILTSTLVIVILEILSHISLSDGNNGGLVFAEDVDTLPNVVIASYLYLPTILAVCYSMVWSWVDLDVKRLEAWFQLSKRDGATANDSLFLQYPFDFLPFIPVTAFRRKHWSVFYAGSIMLIIFWIVTPLISAIFNTGTTTRSISTMMRNSGNLVPFETQKDVLNANFLNTAYGIAWLGQKLPAFTTPEFAVLPFQPASESSTIVSKSKSWSTAANVYSTSLQCTPAKMEVLLNGYLFDNGRGCSATLAVDGIGQYVILYIGWYDDPHLDWSLKNPNCTSEHSNSFLALWASQDDRNDTKFTKMTAIFCETEYEAQNSHITVNASDHAVVLRDTSFPNRSSSSITPLTDIFNTTHFEFMVGVGIQQVEQRANYYDTAIIEQYNAVLEFNLSWPITNMVGFAMGLNSEPVQTLENPKALAKTFERAHQVLFSAAFSTLARSSNNTSLGELRPGTIQGTVEAVILVRTISIIVEIAFGIVVVMVASLWYVAYKRRSLLNGDPASIADIMSMIPNDTECKIPESVETELRLQKFRLANVNIQGKAQLRLIPFTPTAGLKASIDQQDKALLSKNDSHTTLGNFQPVELRLSVGFAFIVVIVLALGSTLFLEIWSYGRNGIALPSKNPVVLSILQNYLPTIFATLLEPVWVVLNRILCLLQPFDELRKGNATSTKSIKAKYTSLPPQLTVWRALRSGHLVLATVCIVAISTNVLAVALSALMEERSTTVTFPMTGARTVLPKFNGRTPVEKAPNNVYYDHFYATISNVTEGTILPPWVDESHFYLPVALRNPSVSSYSGTPLELQGIQLSTDGFGVEVLCSDLSLNESSGGSLLFEPAEKHNVMLFSIFETLSNGTVIRCGLGGDDDLSPGPVGLQNITDTPFAAELIDFTSSFGQCSPQFIAGWARWGKKEPGTTPSIGPGWTTNRTLTKTFLSCTPQLRTASFDVLVDSKGHILKSRQTSNYSTDATNYFVNSSSELKFYQRINELMAPTARDNFLWHNDSFTSDFMNSVLGLKLGSNRLVNPEDPVPTVEEAMAFLKPMYAQLFALLLAFNPFVFAAAAEDKQVPIIIVATEPRIFLSPVAFKMTVVLLCLQLVVAVLYYTNRPKRFLNKMPTSIAAIISFVSASRALEDFSRGAEGEKIPDQRYAYGRFVGTDGKTHVGIEKQRYVVPLKSRNPDATRRRRWMVWKGKKDEREVRSWI